jgi:uncharacterized iron-regulated membrane protein
VTITQRNALAFERPSDLADWLAKNHEASSELWVRIYKAGSARQIGRPAAPQGGGGEHDAHLSWTLRGGAPPMVMSHGDLGPDAAIAAAARHGLVAPWVLDLPDAPGKAYRIAPLIDRAQDARMIYVDPASGRVLQDDWWGAFGIGAKAFEWGIYTHQGQEYGEPNRLIMLTGCIGVWLLAISAPILWWKRRRGGLSSPPPSNDRGKARAVAAIMLAVGVLLPLTGLTMLAALAGDILLARVRSRIAGI